jgi:NAD(P)H-flavin reductase
MPDPSRLRDSTQIVLPDEDLDGMRGELDEQFTVTVVEEGERVRIVGSPVVIKQVSQYLIRRGVQLP